jgi:hypothetical protein
VVIANTLSDAMQAIEKKLEEYKEQEQIAIANVHRVQGARLALEQLLNGRLPIELDVEPIAEDR